MSEFTLKRRESILLLLRTGFMGNHRPLTRKETAGVFLRTEEEISRMEDNLRERLQQAYGQFLWGMLCRLDGSDPDNPVNSRVQLAERLNSLHQRMADVTDEEAFEALKDQDDGAEFVTDGRRFRRVCGLVYEVIDGSPPGAVFLTEESGLLRSKE